jgi:hypothetical protein
VICEPCTVALTLATVPSGVCVRTFASRLSMARHRSSSSPTVAPLLVVQACQVRVGSAIRARWTQPSTRLARSTGSCCRAGCWSRRASRSMSSTRRLIRWASSAIRRIASSTCGPWRRAPCWYSSALARSDASGVRSSWLASAKNRCMSSWLASRSATEASMRVSIPFSAVPRRPTSLRAPALVSPTRWVRSPAVIRSASAAIVSIGRRPRRMTSTTPAEMSRPTAAEPMITTRRNRPTVALTSRRLVLATRVPAGKVTVCTR